MVGLDRPSSGAEIPVDLASDRDRDAGNARIVAAGSYDLVVICAGTSATGPFETVPIEAQAIVLAVNLTAPMTQAAALLRADAIRPGGALVLVASLSHLTGYPGAATYAASKSALAIFAESLRKPLASRGIRVTCVLPGPLDTAHARRHAPPGEPGARMSADDAAAEILRDVGNARSFPGRTAKLAALAGRLAPRMMTRVMRRRIYERFEGADGKP